jgi:hypothetical protein
MKRSTFASPGPWLLLLLALAGCANAADDVVLQREALSGTLLPTGPLTRTSFVEPDEGMREADTDAYYNTATVGVDGTGDTIEGYFTLVHDFYPNDLAAFRGLYFDFAGGTERIAYYYNRGDLGIGREMHCMDTLSQTSIHGFVACYVTNFAGGDDNNEFRFGLSSNIAFANMHANHPFATVAMVYREKMTANTPNNVTFMVFNADGKLTNSAALDRHAFNFTLPDQSVGTPGVNFNLHIPSNCMACHGGSYDHNTHVAQNGLFLPFDLDQFEYENIAGRTRNDQLTAFKHLNESVRKVAVLANSYGGPIAAQLDRWYHNTPSGPAKAEVFEGAYDSTVVPPGWVGFESVYRSFVRRSCRSCHIAAQFHAAGFEMDTEAQFRTLFGYWPVHCNGVMPHAFQSLREFWLSTAPDDAAAYFRAAYPNQASLIDGCSPHGAITLDPPPLMATLNQVAL